MKHHTHLKTWSMLAHLLLLFLVCLPSLPLGLLLLGLLLWRLAREAGELRLELARGESGSLGLKLCATEW